MSVISLSQCPSFTEVVAGSIITCIDILINLIFWGGMVGAVGKISASSPQGPGPISGFTKFEYLCDLSFRYTN